MASAIHPAITPTQVQILLTERCNVTCQHCAVPEEDSPATSELTTEDWNDFIDLLGQQGIESLVVNGGEALLRRDAIDLAVRALEQGITWTTIITNGLLFTAPVASRIADVQRRHPTFGVHVSLDGASPETHDWMRGEGTFDRTMASMQRLLDAGGVIGGVNSVLHRRNLHEVDAFAELVLRLGASSWTVFPLATLGRGAAIQAEQLDPSAWRSIIASARRLRDRTGLRISIGGPVMDDEWPNDLPEVPRSQLAVPPKLCAGPDGDLFTCPPLRAHSFGSASDLGGPTDWEGVVGLVADSLGRSCPSCKYLLVCTGVDLDQPYEPRKWDFGLPSASMQVALRPRGARAPSTALDQGPRQRAARPQR